VKWPKRRSSHACTVLNTASSNEVVTSHLMIMGGWDDHASGMLIKPPKPHALA